MTINEFLKELKKLKRTWRAVPAYGHYKYNGIRTGRSNLHCPISALAATKDEKIRPCDAWGGAQVLGLSRRDMWIIMGAADNSDRLQPLRKRLEKACGL